MLEFAHGSAFPVSQKKTTNDHAERRSRQRFRIQQDVCYACLSGQRISGVGKVLDISSKGAWFTTECALKRGTRVALSLNWPALLNDICPLKLMIYGSVVRSEKTAAAIRIDRYEFRTRASTPTQPVPDPLRCTKGT